MAIDVRWKQRFQNLEKNLLPFIKKHLPVLQRSTLMYGLKQEDINCIQSILSKYQEVDSARIFGSRANGNFRNGSDVDIALKGEKVDFSIVLKISTELNEETMMPYRFDIVDYNSISNPDLKEHIDRVGRVIYNYFKYSESKFQDNKD